MNATPKQDGATARVRASASCNTSRVVFTFPESSVGKPFRWNGGYSARKDGWCRRSTVKVAEKKVDQPTDRPTAGQSL